MSSVINTNVSSLNAQRNLTSSQTALQTSLQRLSSGLRINSAKDDAAGLAISTRMTSQINGLNQAARNANDAISMTQTAEGGLSTIGDMLQRMRDLSVQSANGSNSSSDRAALQKEVSQLSQEIDRTATTTQFNGQNILDGSMSSIQFQVGANANQTIGFSIGSARASALGSYAAPSDTTGSVAQAGTAATGTAGSTGYVAPGFGKNGYGSQDLTIAGNGKVATVSIAQDGTSAKDMAAAINSGAADTGVTATASTTATLSGIASNGNVQLKLKGTGGNEITVSGTVTNTNDLSSLAAAINAQSAGTNITAVADDKGNLTLTNSDGADIGVENISGADTATVKSGTASDTFDSGKALGAGNATDGSNFATVGGTVAFHSSSGFTVNSTITNSSTGAALVSTSTAGTLDKVSDIDVSTTKGANDALSVIDAALQSINNSRADMGALQNRFTSTISNLQTSSENMSAARSRIQDTDFAAETANMTRNQILQQAGTAMLAQANQLPNSVMSLLR